MTVKIPEALKTAMQNGNVVVFLAAGASYGAADKVGRKAPLGAELAKEMADNFSLPPERGLAITAEMAESEAGKGAVRKFLRERFEGLQPTPAIKLLPTFRWKAAVSINYDLLVERAYADSIGALQNIVSFVRDTDPIEQKISSTLNPLPYYKLHGCIEWLGSSDLPLVLTPDSYAQYSTGRTRLFERFRDLAYEHTILFVGFNMEEPHILELINRSSVLEERPTCYLVRPNIHEVEERLLTKRNIQSIDATFDDFMKALDQSVLPLFRTLEVGTSKVQDALKRHLRVNSDPSESLIAALKSSLVHVHDVMRNTEVTPRYFYRGNDYGYDAILSNFDFQRGVSADIVRNAIDAHSFGKVEFHLIFGPAGRGKTIALRRAAFDLSALHDHLVFHVYDNNALRFELFRELHSITGKRITLVVDNVDRKANLLKGVLEKANKESLPLTVLGASREAQWNGVKHGCRPEVTTDYPLGSISRTGFEKLLAKLEENGELGQLAALPPEKRGSAFSGHNRELIAILHEITEGKPFEEILKDEYECLDSDSAQQIYLDVCTLYQFGAPVRAGMIQRLHGIPFNQFKERFFEPLEGVVLTQQNKYTGNYEYIARHPRIAEIVFDQVLDTDHKRLQQVRRVVQHLDSGYASDKAALDKLVRAECADKLLNSMEAKREFFSILTSCLGEQWFIEQHRARLEYRDRKHGDLDLAERHAANAVELSDYRSAAVHTLAEVARYRADKARTPEEAETFRNLAKKRLSDISQQNSSMVIFSRAALMLAELREAIRGKDAERVATLIDRVSTAIRRASNSGDDQSRIDQLNARFISVMGDGNKAADLLLKATRSNPEKAQLRIEAASSLMRLKRYNDAKIIVQEGLDRSSSKPLHYLMSKLLIEAEPGSDETLFHLGRSYAASDRNADARLMRAAFMFSQRDFEGAATILGQLKQRFSASDAMIQLPGSLGNKAFTGIVKTLYQSYALLEVSGFANSVLLHTGVLVGSDWKDVHIGCKVSLKVRFTVRGAQAFHASLTNTSGEK